MIRKIVNQARDYAWGSSNLIPDYFGLEATGKPMAEIWFGTHPASPTLICGTDQTLLEFHEKPLGYLFKILAAAEPLSIQAHPTRQQAEQGFARENALGIPIDSPVRNYKDDQPKPEMVVALTPFRALTGFREATETEVLFAKLQLNSAGALAEKIQIWRDRLAESIESLFSYLIENRDEIAASAPDLIRAAGETLPSAPDFRGNLELLPQLQQLYPGDPGIVISLMMNYVELQPLESLQLDAGNIHAYLSGLVLELMGASDNVMRGGLTPKHIDPQELKSVLRFAGEPVQKLQAKKLANGVFEYPRKTPEYQLYRFELTGGNVLADLDLPDGSIALCTSGEVAIFDSKGETETLKKSEAAFLSDARLYSLTGSGTLFVATS